ncbi:MAG: 50S ribosomal protein L9 [Microthrixaceae bacterium]|nr:50S ribosomal protein L9 [Microthrixaceae bacterium]MCB1012541.1 50S ribosomal protein L9 [Microthrixaceae bacterium]MCB9386909.1 50S ribosomal protein L9 [Microthrixaceae bacterium]MCO5321291.1 50S ribosomal protein L9 [Microthrixaceae bacterium]
MKVILRADVDGLGHRGDIVEVSKGYVRNFLEPRSLAMPATPGAVTQAASMRKARDERDAAAREAAEEIAKVMVSKEITIHSRAGDGGRLFGSVTAAEIVAAVAEQTEIEIDRRAIRLDEHIKSTGSHHVMARLHSDVEFPIHLDVVAD